MLEQVKKIVTTFRQGEQVRRGVGHVIPLWVLLGVFIALLALTWLTVAATYVDLGRWNLWIALGIATVKAFLVALYFMHLRYDKLLHGTIFLFAIFFVMLFVGLVLMDSTAYRSELIEDYAPAISEEQGAQP